MGLLFTWVSLPVYANEQATAIKNIQEIRISLDSVWVVMGGHLGVLYASRFCIGRKWFCEKQKYHQCTHEKLYGCLFGWAGVLVSWFWIDVWFKYHRVVWLESFCTE